MTDAMKRQTVTGWVAGLARRALAVLLVSVLGATTGTAQQILVQVGDTTMQPRLGAAPGSQISVPIVVDLSQAGGLDIASLTFELNWNSSQLSYVSASPGGFGSVVFNETQTGAGVLTTSMFNATGTTSTFTVATVVVTAANLLPDQCLCITMSISVTAAGDEAGSSILGSLIGEGLTVCIGLSGLLGDVNDDGVANILDAQQVARYSVGLPPPPDPAGVATTGDVNEDGAVNIIDAQQIARYSVGLPTPGAPDIGLPGGCLGVDVVAGALSVTPANPMSGQLVTIEGSITNAGSESTAGPFSWEIRVDGQVEAEGRPDLLAAGETSNQIAAANIGPFGVGAHTVELLVDTQDELAEVNEGNNTSSTSLVIAAVPVASVQVEPATADVVAGQTVQLTATTYDADGNELTGRVIEWSSSNEAVATVDATGLVTGVAVGGPVTITATSEGVSGTAEIKVTDTQAQTSLYLRYVSANKILSSQPATAGAIGLTFFGSTEFPAVLGNAITGTDYAFAIWLGAGTASGQTGTVTATILTEHNGVETSLATHTFTVPYNTNYVEYTANVTGIPGGTAGDKIVLRLTVTGVSQGGVLFGVSPVDSHILVPGNVTVSPVTSPPGVSAGEEAGVKVEVTAGQSLRYSGG